MLATMVEDMEGSGYLADLWLVTACIVGFAAYLRFDELVYLRLTDVKINDDFMTTVFMSLAVRQISSGKATKW